MHATFLVIGGGSSGCVMAARLSERPENSVVLVEAGTDYPPGRTPADIADLYAGSALMNPSYFWQNLKARRSADAKPAYYEQGRVLGGGSSVNGQAALRGAPADFDEWETLGAHGWNWDAVLPYFRRLETDHDFRDQFHGAHGPIAIRRLARAHWDDFTLAVTQVWEGLGYSFLPDMNGEFGAGYAPVPMANDGTTRVSTAIGYLDATARLRPNLTILSNTQARRILFEAGRASGAELRRDGASMTVTADHVIVCAGALHTPHLLMLSGIGPGGQLREHGISVKLDLPGVGQHLMDHPAIQISGYLPKAARRKKVLRGSYTYLRWSSGYPGMPEADMVMLAICRSAWHAVGARIGTLGSNVGKSFSTGEVRLASASPDDEPDVNFNWLSDQRDLDRLCDAVVLMAGILRTDPVPHFLSNLFPSKFSQRVRDIGRKTRRNAALTSIAAALMDSSAGIRALLFDHVISDSPKLDDLLADRGKLERYVRDNVHGAWHASCTCRMGDPADPMTVVDPQGLVVGAENLYIADASVMPDVSRTNTNLPTIMIAERLVELIGGRRI